MIISFISAMIWVPLNKCKGVIMIQFSLTTLSQAADSLAFSTSDPNLKNFCEQVRKMAHDFSNAEKRLTELEKLVKRLA